MKYKEDILMNVSSAFLHIMKVNGVQNIQTLKKHTGSMKLIHATQIV